MITEKSYKLMDRICYAFARHPWKVLIVVLIVTALFFNGALKIRGEVILQDMLPFDHPYLKLHARFSEVFGSGGSTVAIAVAAKEGDIFNKKTLGKIKAITEEIELWNEAYRMLTVSIASYSTKVVRTLAAGEIKIGTLMYPNIPQNETEMEELKRNIFSNPAYDGVFVTKDGKAGLILTEMKENISYEMMFTKLRETVAKYSDDETSIHIVGYPMLMGWIYSLKTQMYTVFAISIAAIALVLWLLFRNIAGMAAPMINAIILTIWGLGFTGLMGINFNPMLFVLAFLVGSRMVSNSVQITYRYFEELHANKNDRIEAGYKTMRAMMFPNWSGVITDCAGFAVLYLAKITLMQNLSIIMTFWMFTIVVTSITVPTICSMIPLTRAGNKWAKENSRIDTWSKIMMVISRFSIGPKSRYATGSVIIIIGALCLWQTIQLKIGDPTPGSPVFYPDHTYNRDQAFINERFNASSENFLLFYEGKPNSVYEPVVTETFEQFANHMATELPDIYKTSSSIIDLAKMINVMNHDGDPAWHQLPRNEGPLLGLFGLVRNTAGQVAMTRFIDRNIERAQITLYFSDHTSNNLLRIRDAAYQFFEDHPVKTKNGEFKLAGGRIGMEIAVNEEMKKSHFIIDLTVYIAIFFLCCAAFRSFTAGIMLTFPLLLANAIAGAVMNLMNIGLSINTLPVAAIGAGLGVDFAIYLYSRFKEEFLLQKGDWYETIIQSITTCGKAVVYTGITIILPIMTWFVFSEMKFQAQVGFFLSVIMATNVILCLALHPLLLYIIKPQFMSKQLQPTTARSKEGITSI